MKTQLHKASHVAYSIHLHIYLVTRYRAAFLTQPIVDCVVASVDRICKMRKSELVEWGAEPDHIHFLIDLHPDNNISQLVKSLKSVSTKDIKAQFPTEYKATYWRGSGVWGRQKGIISCGGAPLDIVKQYVQNQAGVDA